MENSFIDPYETATPFFYWFSKLFESKARDKSLDLSRLKNGHSILIIAPPTEFYIHKLLESNSEGENHLIYCSDQMKAKLGLYQFIGTFVIFSFLASDDNIFLMS